jgi:hypothetical protein
MADTIGLLMLPLCVCVTAGSRVFNTLCRGDRDREGDNFGCANPGATSAIFMAGGFLPFLRGLHALCELSFVDSRKIGQLSQLNHIVREQLRFISMALSLEVPSWRLVLDSITASVSLRLQHLHG